MLREVAEDVSRVEELDEGHPTGDIDTVHVIPEHQGAPGCAGHVELLPHPQQRGHLKIGDKKTFFSPVSHLTRGHLVEICNWLNRQRRQGLDKVILAKNEISNIKSEFSRQGLWSLQKIILFLRILF